MTSLNVSSVQQRMSISNLLSTDEPVVTSTPEKILITVDHSKDEEQQKSLHEIIYKNGSLEAELLCRMCQAPNTPLFLLKRKIKSLLLQLVSRKKIDVVRGICICLQPPSPESLQVSRDLKKENALKALEINYIIDCTIRQSNGTSLQVLVDRLQPFAISPAKISRILHNLKKKGFANFEQRGDKQSRFWYSVDRDAE